MTVVDFATDGTATIRLVPDQTEKQPFRVDLAQNTRGAEPTDADRSVPLFIPSSQAYYWSSEWQEGENEAVVALRAGESRHFDDPREAIKWLLADEG